MVLIIFGYVRMIFPLVFKFKSNMNYLGISIGAGPVEPAEIQEQALFPPCRGRSPASDHAGKMVEKCWKMMAVKAVKNLYRICFWGYVGRFSDQQI